MSNKNLLLRLLSALYIEKKIIGYLNLKLRASTANGCKKQVENL